MKGRVFYSDGPNVLIELVDGRRLQCTRSQMKRPDLFPLLEEGCEVECELNDGRLDEIVPVFGQSSSLRTALATDTTSSGC